MYLTIFLFVLPFSSAYYSFKGSPVLAINHTVWREIATGKSPWVWMINFYCKGSPRAAKSGMGQKCSRSFEVRNEYTDAVHMLKGIVKAASFLVNEKFPAFVRVPCVMLYMPNSTEPYVYEMENFPEQIKRPAFRLVQYIKDVVINHVKDVAVRNILRGWALNHIQDVNFMKKIITNSVPTQCYFVLIHDGLQTNMHMVQILETVATAITYVHNIPETQVNFGLANFVTVKEALKDWNVPYVVPKFWFFGPRNSPQNKQLTFAYDGRMDAADITRWVINRHTDMMVIPGDAVQINIKREPGFVGQLIEVEDKIFFMATI